MKAVSMQAERPCRNGAFEESVNAPFRARGGREITTTENEGVWVFFPSASSSSSSSPSVRGALGGLLSGYFGGVWGLTGVTD